MERLEDCSVLHALYKEASTRRHTADVKEAELWASESADRGSSKLSIESALLLDTKLRREVAHAFEKHQLPGTGFLTKAQLQAALHSLALLDSRPAAFSSSAQRSGPVPVNALPLRHAHRHSQVVDRVWQILTAASSQVGSDRLGITSAPASSLRPQIAAEAGYETPSVLHQHTILPQQQLSSTECESFDSLLSQGLDLWQQLTGDVDSVHDNSPEHKGGCDHAAETHAAKVDSSSLTCASHPKLTQLWQPARVKSSGMHGVTLQQLLSFVQLVQQQNSSSIPAAEAVLVAGAATQQQQAELSKLAHTCSQNRLTNLTYSGIGNRKLHQQPLVRPRPPGPGLAPGTHAVTAGPPQPVAVAVPLSNADRIGWHPRGQGSRRQAAVLAANAVRFSRQQHRQRELKQQHTKQQQRKEQQHTQGRHEVSPGPCRQTLGAQPSRPHSARLKGTAGQELAKQQPFARSASTAAEMVKRRQALAELEMVPCTFHPLLDPHSLTLVAAKGATYKAPQNAGPAHTRAPPAQGSAREFAPRMRVSSAGSAGDETREELHARSVASQANLAHGAGPEAEGGPRSGQIGLASWDVQEQRALRECTFAPQLNKNSKTTSVVARQWKGHGAEISKLADQHPAPAVDTNSYFKAITVRDEVPVTASAALEKEAAPVAAGPADQASVVSSELQQQAAMPEEDAQVAQLQIPARSKSGKSPMVVRRRQRQLNDSYVAAAHRRIPAQTAGTANADSLPQHSQPQESSHEHQSASEEQLQADVQECDRRLEQHQKLRRRVSKQQHLGSAVVSSCTACPTSSVVNSSGQQQQQDEGTHVCKSGLKVALEAVLPDGSASRFEVQQADRLRHLAKYFATMLELEAVAANRHAPEVHM